MQCHHRVAVLLLTAPLQEAPHRVGIDSSL
jgi:hypothetical protein